MTDIPECYVGCSRTLLTLQPISITDLQLSPPKETHSIQACPISQQIFLVCFPNKL